jgi:uncharacterized membrane protein (DUF485 family)
MVDLTKIGSATVRANRALLTNKSPFSWKMTKGMGIVMLVLYILFVIVTLGFSYRWYECPV